MADPKTYTQDEFDAMVQERDALKQNRDEILREKKKADLALKNWDGKDPAKYDALVAAADEAERKKALAEGNLEVWKKQVTDQHLKERETDAKRIQKYETALGRRLRQDELRRALTGKAEDSMMELLVEHGSKFINIKETDDGFDGFVADEKGNPLVADGVGTAMTVDQFVEQRLKSKFPAAFKGSGSSGGGATKSSGGAGGGSPSTIPAGDAAAWNANLEGIASGKVTIA